MTKGFSVFIHDNQVQISNNFEQGTYDSVFVETPTVSVLIEGIILNKKDLLKNSSISFQEYLVDNYLKNDWRVLQQLEGEFRGCIWDKQKKKVLIFTNPTSTQRVFYTKIDHKIFADSDLVRLSRTIKENSYSLSPDMTSIYQLLAIGNLLENRTPIENVYKVVDSHFLEIDCEERIITEKEYFNISGIEYYNKKKENAVDDIHEIFTEAVKWEYEKDLEFNTSSLAFLSGGLDSRMAMLYAIQNKFDIGCALCFSHSGYFDEKISRKIAEDYQLHYEFIPLDNGSFLKKIDQLTKISEGTSLYSGGIHVQYALDKLAFQNFSIFHGGQIGDGILGGFNSEPMRKPPSEYKIIVNQDFLPKIQSDLKSIMSNYEREEVFLLQNLAYNRTVLGVQTLQPRGYLISPFMTKDFIKLSLSLPEEWKFKHKFYLEWLSKHCKEAEKYTWERTLMKPNAYWKVGFGEKYIKNGYLFFYNKILKSPEKASMYPYQYYFDSTPEIQQYYQIYFNENIGRLEAYPELRDDVIQLFAQKSFYHKCQAINILSIFKLYF
ncbi:asparagine synthetase B family protein [Chryseobacterium oryctis]|uniref:asparagine synthase (glutamine-hydrolyzing) n=1 Tax=Chryseobacterium oryctis TaxID=2952618 RepID=A0ABT3HMA0_9FLAO|nr:asparagine synthase-related protein [Chryseobacterium oryctis]MCW3160908.1 asparagine synthase-related protein [Chryseobacterium oryctis]